VFVRYFTKNDIAIALPARCGENIHAFEIDRCYWNFKLSKTLL